MKFSVFVAMNRKKTIHLHTTYMYMVIGGVRGGWVQDYRLEGKKNKKVTLVYDSQKASGASTCHISNVFFYYIALLYGVPTFGRTPAPCRKGGAEAGAGGSGFYDSACSTFSQVLVTLVAFWVEPFHLRSVW